MEILKDGGSTGWNSLYQLIHLRAVLNHPSKQWPSFNLLLQDIIIFFQHRVSILRKGRHAPLLIIITCSVSICYLVEVFAVWFFWVFL